MIFSLSTIAKAQPPEQPAVSVPQRHILPAELTISNFVSAFTSGSFVYAARFVVGGDGGNSALQGLRSETRDEFDHFHLDATDIKIMPDAKKPNLAKANFTLILRDNVLGFTMQKEESVALQKYISKDDELWLIIPNNLEKESFFTSGNPFLDAHDKPTNIIERFAAMIAYPQKALLRIHLRQSSEQLKQLGLSLKMLVQDYDERIALTQQNFKEKLTPYMKNASLFTAPDDPPGTISFNINPNIVGLPMNAIKDYKNTVAFYLGNDQKLDFRYDGLSVVCFMNGHVEAISSEQAKQLQWKP